MTRPSLLCLLCCLTVSGGCGQKIVKVSNPAVVADEVPNAGFLGVVDTTGGKDTMKDMSMIMSSSDVSGFMTSVESFNYKDYTGNLDTREVAGRSTSMLVSTVVPVSLSGAAGNDFGVASLKSVAESYPELDCLVLVELGRATWSPEAYTRRGLLAAYTNAVLLGLATPFVVPWVKKDMSIPINVEGAVRVFDARTGRFEVNEDFRTEGRIVVSGMNFTQDDAKELLDLANRTGGKMLAAAVDDKIACAVPTPPMRGAPVEGEAADDEADGSEAAEE